VPLSVGEAESPSNTMWAWAEAYLCTKRHPNPCNRLATIDQRYGQTGRQTGETDFNFNFNFNDVDLRAPKS